ncbi:MAG TPA: dihydroneopterin aldolase [Flavobacteriales bacterium]|nr:dihydroneopterin aldolase [Flavobacteriales bacterium]
MAIVSIHDLKVYGYHGCLPEEAVIGTMFKFDIDVETDFTKAYETDDLKHAVDYVEIVRIVKEQMAIRNNLIETVVKRVVDKIRERYPNAVNIKVRLYKMNPPAKGDLESVSVYLEG